MSYFIRLPDGKQWCGEISHRTVSARQLKEMISDNLAVHDEDTYMLQNGSIIAEDAVVELIPDATIHVCHRVFGGKGGFGSMLRAIGAQIEKTTNREACRDLSGRRMRDVNDEKKVTEWVAQQADREREEARKRAERLERRRAEPRHVFDDKGYTENIRQNADRIGEALQHGMKTTGAVSSSSNGKRKLDEPSTSSGKRGCMWLGLDNEDMSEDSDEDDGEKVHLEASPCQRPSSSTCSKPSAATLSSPPHPPCNPSPGSSTSRSDTPEHKDTLPDSSTTNSSSEQPTPSQSGDELRTNPSEATGVDSSTVAAVAAISASDVCSVSDPQHSNQEESLCSSNTPQDTTQSKSESVNLDEFTTAEELEVLGLDRLKTALTCLGLKCGGTLHQRAQRLFSVKGLAPDQIDPQLLATSQKKNGKKKHK